MIDFESVEKELNLKFENLEMKIAYLYYVKKYSMRHVSKELRCSTHVVRDSLMNTFGIRDKQKVFELRSTPDFKEKLRRANTGEIHPKAKLTESDVIAIRKRYSDLLQLSTFTKTQARQLLADEYGVKPPTIASIVFRRNWKHI